MKKLYYITTLFLIFTFNIFAQNNSASYLPDSSNASPDTLEGYKLIWHDEFDKGYIDPDKWTHEVFANQDSNGSVEYYTDRPENSYVQDGKLFIVARHEHYEGPDGTREFTSARLNTKNKGDWKYGKVLVRAKLPHGVGTWPAIWMMPTESVYGWWPKSGEIDIMEHLGSEENKIYGTVHTNKYNHVLGTQKGSTIIIDSATTKFHVYSIDWTDEYIDFFVDDQFYYRFNNEHKTWEEWPFDQKFYAILNVAIGGSWAGQNGIDTSAFPTQMVIDYVRVYKKNELPVPKYYMKQAGDNWSLHKLYDDGTNGDKIAYDGVYSRLLTISAQNDMKIDWVVTDSNFTDITRISWFYNPQAPSDILFTFDTNVYNDEFLPQTNIMNTNEDLGGNFTVVVKGESDTLKFVNEMTDDGNLANADTIMGDGIYSLKKIIKTPGNYVWFVHHNAISWAVGPRWCQYGKVVSWSDTDAVAFSTTKPDQPVDFFLDVKHGRISYKVDTTTHTNKNLFYIKTTGDNLIPHPLFDDGTNGDEIAEDGVYSVSLNVEYFNSGKYEWFVTDSSFVKISKISWFNHSPEDSVILFTFDKNLYYDSWFPKYNVCNTDENTDSPFILKLVNDKDSLLFAEVLKDDGNTVNGDSVAGDKIFTLRKTIKSPGEYCWFVYTDSVKYAWTKYGKTVKSNYPDKIKFVTLDENQGVTFFLNLNTGRLTSQIDPPQNPPNHKKYYVKYDGDGWKAHLMRDDGLFGDETAYDNVYSLLLPVDYNSKYKSDWAVSDGYKDVGGISWFYNPEGTHNILFTFDVNHHKDGWLPVKNITNTDEEIIKTGPIGINIDSMTFYAAMTDNGTLSNGDSIASDGIFAFCKTIDSPGLHRWFAFHNTNLQKRWDAKGKHNGWSGAHPDSVDFYTTVPNQIVYFFLDINTGRLKTESDSTIVGINNTTNNLPTEFKLYQNYPNPFNPSTTITYTIPTSETLHATSQQLVQLKIYDILGREVATLINKKQKPGNYEVIFDASGLPSGIYIYKLITRGFTQARNMILLK